MQWPYRTRQICCDDQVRICEDSAGMMLLGEVVVGSWVYGDEDHLVSEEELRSQRLFHVLCWLCTTSVTSMIPNIDRTINCKLSQALSTCSRNSQRNSAVCRSWERFILATFIHEAGYSSKHDLQSRMLPYKRCSARMFAAQFHSTTPHGFADLCSHTSQASGSLASSTTLS